MLRTACTSLTRSAPVWRSLSTVRSFTTAVPPPSDKKTKTPLSERLGAGRGKALDASSDPFSSFLASAKNNRGPNRRNGNFTPRQKKNDNNKTPTQAAGQFDDAEKKVTATASGEGKPERKRNNKNNNNNNNRNNNNNNRNRKPQQQQANSAGQTEGGEKRGPRPDRRNNMRRNRTQPDEVRTRRATAFIDKDIDWASFDTTTAEVAVEVKEGQEENSNELLLKDIQGDYDRYLAVGSDVNWAKAINPAAVSTLIGSNATFDYQQKAAFLATLSNATSGGPAAAARK